MFFRKGELLQIGLFPVIGMLLLISMITIIACKTKKYAYKDMPGNYLVFGSGGGFRGIEDRYILIESGQIFYGVAGAKEMKEMKGITASKAKKYLQDAKKIFLDTVELSPIGNTYQFMEYVDGILKKRISWSGNIKMNPVLSDMYHTLNMHVQKNKK